MTVDQLRIIIQPLLIDCRRFQVPWKVVCACCLIQQVMAVVVMRWEAGNKAISWLADLITWFLNFAQYGARVVFGETYTDHTFAMAVVALS